MILNYLKIAWRNMVKNKTFALINIIGLSLGISVCFIIMMYVQHELSYDRYNKNADRIAPVSYTHLVSITFPLGMAFPFGVFIVPEIVNDFSGL